MKRAIGAVLVALVLIGFTACGGGSDDVSKSKFKTQLVKSAGRNDKEATCISDAMFKAFDQDSINKLYKAEKEKDVPKEDADKLKAIVTKCLS
jgi:hypothetical protein